MNQRTLSAADRGADDGLPSGGSARNSAAQNGAYEVRAVQRALDVLDAVQDAPNGLTLAQVARVAGLPKSSAFRYLTTLESRGYLERDGDGCVHLGRRLLPLRSRRLEALTTVARPHLDELRERFQETINLAVLDGSRIAYLEIVESPSTIRLAPRQGDRDPIHSTALGKAIGAILAPDQVRRILSSEGMPRLTPRTIVEPDAFLVELEAVRERGFALDDGENERGGRCVAVPLPLDDVRAAISLSAPAFRFRIEQVDGVAAALVRTARSIGAELTRARA